MLFCTHRQHIPLFRVPCLERPPAPARPPRPIRRRNLVPVLSVAERHGLRRRLPGAPGPDFGTWDSTNLICCVLCRKDGRKHYPHQPRRPHSPQRHPWRRLHLRFATMMGALDKDESFVKSKLRLGGAQAPRVSPEGLRTRAFANHATSSFEGHVFRPTNHRYGHQRQAMMLPCEHPAYCRMRERSFKVTTSLVPVRGTRELLSIWAISG